MKLEERYRVIRKLGEGGMGEVYLVEHVHLGRQEALKILQPAIAVDPQFAARFRREARATNRLSHPNIVGVYDFGRLPDGRFYLSMEYVEGTRLDLLLRQLGTLPVPRALHVLGQLADAIDHAHGRGVLHRDLKPDNLILTKVAQGPLRPTQLDVLKILDLGMAKIIAPDHVDSLVLSAAGQILGTPLYMSPEQAVGVAASPQSDLYTIGCIAFELLVGEPPFRGGPAALMNAHSTKPPDRPGARRPAAAIPPALDQIVLRCLEKDPAQRFPSGAALLAALQQVPGYPAKRPAGGPRSWTRMAALREPVTDDFGGDTVSGTQVEEPALAAAPTQLARIDLDGEDATAAARATLGALAEELLALGATSAPLVVHLATARELEEKLAHGDDELETLERRIADLDRAARERERSLRFGLGELRFARDQLATVGAAGAEAGEHDHQIHELEQRLGAGAEEHHEELRVLTDRAIARTAAQATAAEALEQTYAGIERLVARLASGYEHEPSVARLLGRLREARARSASASAHQRSPVLAR